MYNREEPLIMHVDLNSAFATIEQQSRPLLRGKPVAIINRRTEFTAIVTASYEAKDLGVKVGMRFIEAARLAPGLIGIESDPPKYRFVYQKLMNILNSYSPNVVMKSIDEGVLDFHGFNNHRSLIEIGHEIKQRLRDEIGIWMRCNVGIGANRFLAKTAAGLHKPDGLDVITADNLRSVYETLELTDLTGIASQYGKRLRAVGIDTPIKFLDADEVTLQKIVFKGICGRQWHARLRGYEVDDREVTTKTVGRQYVLEERNLTRVEITARLHHLCESVGYRLRSQDKLARGVFVYAKTLSHKYWHASRMCQLPFYSDGAINSLAQLLFADAPEDIKEIGIRCYGLCDDDDKQLSLLGDILAREQNLVGAIDDINKRYGDRTIHSANTLTTSVFVKQKIPFGSTRYL
jgi:DNA polymerase-4